MLTINRQIIADETSIIPAETRALHFWIPPGSPPTPSTQHLFGWEIPFLLRVLDDPTLSAEDRRSKLDEWLERWAEFLAGLWKWRGSAYVLRWYWEPTSGSLRLFFLGRFIGSFESASTMRDDLARKLTAFRLPIRTLEDAELRLALNPVSGEAHCIELLQREELVTVQPIQNGQRESEFYTIYPLKQPRGNFLLPLQIMAQQEVPVVVSIHLEPTNLHPEERKAIEQARRIADSLATVQLPMEGSVPQITVQNALFREIGRTFGETSLRLKRETFLIAAHVASADYSVADTVARALASAAATSDPQIRDQDASATLLDLFPAPANAKNPVAYEMRHLTLTPWVSTEAQGSQVRLRYLANALAAASLFRPPVANTVPGMDVKSFPLGGVGPLATKSLLPLGRGILQNRAIGVNPQQLTRHALVTGFTGSGKTNTVLNLLHQLRLQHGIPFLVIEGAKSEYRTLMSMPGFENMLVFTPGDETTSPFRLNPLEVLPGVKIESHIARLRAAINAAMAQFGALPAIIEESLYKSYEDFGWSFTDVGTEDDERVYPTLADVLERARAIVSKRYTDKTGQDLQGALDSRLGALLLGSKGQMFNTQRSLPPEILFEQPTILEMQALNEDDRALLVMFLLIWLREYREHHRSRDGSLRHLTVIEEAHQIAGKTESVGASEVAADTAGKSVKMFVDMLAEIREYGQGIMIADQSVGRLAPEVLGNTNIQITHQLRSDDDRQRFAQTVQMDEANAAYLGRMEPGEACVFYTGLSDAVFVRMDRFAKNPAVGDAAVRAHMHPFRKAHIKRFLPFNGCTWCQAQCDFRDKTAKHCKTNHAHAVFDATLNEVDITSDEGWQELVRRWLDTAAAIGYPGEREAAWCYFVHMFDAPPLSHIRSPHRESFMRAYQQLYSGRLQEGS